MKMFGGYFRQHEHRVSAQQRAERLIKKRREDARLSRAASAEARSAASRASPKARVEAIGDVQEPKSIKKKRPLTALIGRKSTDLKIVPDFIGSTPTASSHRKATPHLQ